MEKNQKSSKKYLATAISASVVTSLVAPALAEANFNDVAKGTFYEAAVHALTSKGVIGGFSDGTFKPDKLVTRAEAAKMIAFDLKLSTTNTPQTLPTFKDIQKDDWYYQPVTALSNAGLMSGYQDGTFKPNQTITRAEMASLLVRAYSLLHGKNSIQNPFQDVQPNDWFGQAVQVLYDNKVTSGKSADYFGANDPVTRGEIAAFIFKANTITMGQASDPIIEAVTDHSVTISGETYSYSEQLKGLFNTTNASALKGARILFEGENKVITKITYLELNISGKPATNNENEFSNNLVLDGQGATIDGSIDVNANFITIKNLTVTGHFKITEDLQNDFLGENVKILGNTYINGGDENTVVFRNCSLEGVSVQKSDVRVESQGSTTISEISVSSNAVISADSGVTILIEDGAEEIEINGNINTLDVTGSSLHTITGTASIGELRVSNGAFFTLEATGKIEKLVIEKGAKITLGSGVTIDELQLPEGVKIEHVITNYQSVKHHIKKIVQLTAPSGGGGVEDDDDNDSTPAFALSDINISGVSNKYGEFTIGKVRAKSDRDGFLYLVPKATTPRSVADLDHAIGFKEHSLTGSKITVKKNRTGEFDLSEFALGTYVLYAVDTEGNISKGSQDIFVNGMAVLTRAVNLNMALFDQPIVPDLFGITTADTIKILVDIDKDNTTTEDTIEIQANQEQDNITTVDTIEAAFNSTTTEDSIEVPFNNTTTGDSIKVFSDESQIEQASEESPFDFHNAPLFTFGLYALREGIDIEEISIQAESVGDIENLKLYKVPAFRLSSLENPIQLLSEGTEPSYTLTGEDSFVDLSKYLSWEEENGNLTAIKIKGLSIDVFREDPTPLFVITGDITNIPLGNKVTFSLDKEHINGVTGTDTGTPVTTYYLKDFIDPAALRDRDRDDVRAIDIPVSVVTDFLLQATHVNGEPEEEEIGVHRLFDSDANGKEIAGELRWEAWEPDKPNNAAHYKIFFTNFFGQKIGPAIGEISKEAGRVDYSFTIPENTVVPAGASMIGVFPSNQYGESTGRLGFNYSLFSDLAMDEAIAAKEKLASSTDGQYTWEEIIAAYDSLRKVRSSIPAFMPTNLKAQSIDDVDAIRDYYASISAINLSGQRNPLGDTSVLSIFTGLTSLNLANTDTDDFEGIINLTNLKQLNLANNSIDSLYFLFGLPRIEELDISGNNLDSDSIEVLTKLYNLKNLNVSNNDLSSVAALITLAEDGLRPTSDISWDISNNPLENDDKQLERLKEAIGDKGTLTYNKPSILLLDKIKYVEGPEAQPQIDIRLTSDLADTAVLKVDLSQITSWSIDPLLATDFSAIDNNEASDEITAQITASIVGTTLTLDPNSLIEANNTITLTFGNGKDTWKTLNLFNNGRTADLYISRDDDNYQTKLELEQSNIR